MTFNIIVACNLNHGIGKNNNLLYRLKQDMKYFKDITTKVNDENKQNAVIMGRKTYESIPKKFRPLPSRLNIVITRNKNYPKEEDLIVSNSFEEALSLLKSIEKIENIFVIGGGEIYQTALKHPECKNIYITKINDILEADIFFPKLNESFQFNSSMTPIIENDVKCFDGIRDIEYQFLVYSKK